jgi:glycosyltransferase involved in cell wall biosynthesis
LQISVVIITKNEACNIVDCIRSARKISNDIIVIDSGSTDATVSLAKAENANVHSILWEGYGYSRNTGAKLARNDWIFSLDADERVTSELAGAVAGIVFPDAPVIYGFKRVNYFGNKKIRYGALAHDRVFRLYNRRHSSWNMAPVHERLTGTNLKRVTISAYAIHYGINTEAHYLQKRMGYAVLCAFKYQQEKKKFIYAISLFAPAFNFIKAYIFQLGFLDQQRGFIIAKINAYYTRKKYRQLRVLLSEEKGYETRPTFLRHSLRKIISFLS